MSWNLGIYAGSNESLDDFAQELQALWDIPFERKSDRWETWYQHGDPDVYITIGEHNHSNDRDLRFEDYRYSILLWPRKHYLEEVREQWRKELAPMLVNKLKAIQRYPLMLVEEGQIKLDEYHPEGDVAQQHAG